MPIQTIIICSSPLALRNNLCQLPILHQLISENLTYVIVQVA